MGSALRYLIAGQSWGPRDQPGLATLAETTVHENCAINSTFDGLDGTSTEHHTYNASHMFPGPYGIALGTEQSMEDVRDTMQGQQHMNRNSPLGHVIYNPTFSSVMSPNFNGVAHHDSKTSSKPSLPMNGVGRIRKRNASINGHGARPSLASYRPGSFQGTFEGMQPGQWLTADDHGPTPAVSLSEDFPGPILSPDNEGPSPVEPTSWKGEPLPHTALPQMLGIRGSRPASSAGRPTSAASSRASLDSPSPNAVSPVDSGAPPDAVGRRRGNARRAISLERNRIAAHKCREKRKAQVSQLEQTVRLLQKDKAALQIVARGLWDEVLELWGLLLEHEECGGTNIQDFLSRQAKSIARDGQKLGVSREELDRLLQRDEDSTS